MSGCERLAPERMAALLDGSMAEDERSALGAHLREGACEACVERIEAVDIDRIMEALAGPEARLSAEESDALFERARAVRPISGARRWTRVALAMAASVAAVALSAKLWTRDGDDGVKSSGAAALEIALEAVVGRTQPDGRPAIDRRFVGRGRVAAGEQVVFRWRVSRRAHLTLIVDRGSGGSVEWASPPSALEGEVTAGGQAMALDAARIEGRAHVWMVASEAALPESTTTVPGQPPRCERCAIARLEIER